MLCVGQFCSLFFQRCKLWLWWSLLRVEQYALDAVLYSFFCGSFLHPSNVMRSVVGSQCVSELCANVCAAAVSAIHESTTLHVTLCVLLLPNSLKSHSFAIRMSSTATEMTV